MSCGLAGRGEGARHGTGRHDDVFLPLCLSQEMLNAYLVYSTRQKLISWRARDLVGTAMAAPSLVRTCVEG
jgi:hypothetical protein